MQDASGCRMQNKPGPVRDPIVHPRQGVKKRIADHQPGVMIGDTSECPPDLEVADRVDLLFMEAGLSQRMPAALRPRPTSGGGHETVWFLDHPGPWAGNLTKIAIERATMP